MSSETLDQSTATQPVLSIVILTFNHEKFIGKCLDRILSIADNKTEIVILDDGSTDTTVSVIERYLSLMPNLRLLRQKNTGNISHNTKKLLEQAVGEFVTFLSGDDMLGEDFPIKSIVELFNRNSDCFAILTPGILLDAGPRRYLNSSRLDRILETENPAIVLRQHLRRRVSRIFLQGVTIRRELLTLSGMPSESNLDDDYEFIFRLFLALDFYKKTFIYLKSTHWEYRIHSENLHKNGVRQLEITLRVIQKQIPPRKTLLFRYDVPTTNSRQELQQALNIIAEHTSNIIGLYLSLHVRLLYLHGKLKRTLSNSPSKNEIK
jgi:glycosyltransferase involved in cell wall biosynthesis